MADSEEKETFNNNGTAGDSEGGVDEEDGITKKDYRRFTFIGPLTMEEEERHKAKNLASRRSRRQKTAMGSIKKLEDGNIGNCEVFFLACSKGTGQSWYCRSDCFVEKFKVNQPLCDFNPGYCRDVFRSSELTNMYICIVLYTDTLFQNSKDFIYCHCVSGTMNSTNAPLLVITFP